MNFQRLVLALSELFRKGRGVPNRNSLFALLLLLVWWALPVAAEKVKIPVPSKTNPAYFMPALTAQEKGFWSEQGLEAEWVGLGSTAVMMAAVNAGEVFVGLHTMSGHVSWSYRGAPVVMIADTGQGNPFYIWVASQSPVKAPADLKGRKIGVTRLGSVTHAYAQAFAKAAGLERDIKVVATGEISNTLAGLRVGAIDATPMMAITMMSLEQEGIVRRLASLASYDIPSDIDTFMVYATRQGLAQRPETVRKVVAGLVKAMDFIMRTPDWATERIKIERRLSGPAAKQVYELLDYSRDGRIKPARLEKIRSFLLQYGLLPKGKEVPLKELYTDRFVPVE